MPINFVTGLPRNGKTLWTVTHVKALAEKEKRDVYYCNIPGVTIASWLEIQHPNDWMTVPDSAIIVVDELQDFWGELAIDTLTKEARVNPESRKQLDLTNTAILELSKHGKRGIDFFFITQDPALVVMTPRKLCELHYHVIRAFGTQSAVLYKYRRIQVNPELKTVKETGEKTIFKYPVESFSYYKSADVHNIKRRIPFKILAIPVGLIFTIGMFYGAYYMLTKGGAIKNPVSGLSPKDQPIAGALPSAVSPVVSAADFIASYQERISGFPHSAPRFDEVTKPVIAPYPAACVSSKKRCKCYTQQGTVLATPADICAQIVANGFFVDWALPDQQQVKPLPPAQIERVNQTAEMGADGVLRVAKADILSGRIQDITDGSTHTIMQGRKPWTSRFSDTPTLSTMQKDVK